MGTFVSHDGNGTEVYVIVTHNAYLERLNERNETVEAVFKAPHLKHPLTGWINKDKDPETLQALQQLLQTGDPAVLRVEVARRSDVDRAIPINTLRDDKDARNLLLRRLVGVNELYTSEIKTNPDSDPVERSAFNQPAQQAPQQQAPAQHYAPPASAAPQPHPNTILSLISQLNTNRAIPEAVIDSLKAAALLAGATPEHVQQAGAVEGAPAYGGTAFTEAPPFKDYNNNGSYNLGNGHVSATVGVTNYVHEKLWRANNEAAAGESVTEFFSNLLLAMADFIQADAYKGGFRPDRSAASHVRVRSIIFSLIDTSHALPKLSAYDVLDLNDKLTVHAWMVDLGKAARAMFINGIQGSLQFRSIADVMQTFAAAPAPVVDEGAQVAPEPAAPAQEATEAPVTPQEPAPAPAPAEAPEVVESTPQAVAGVVTGVPTNLKDGKKRKAEIAAREQAYAEMEAAEASSAEQEEEDAEDLGTPMALAPDTSGLEMYEQNILPSGSITSENAPTEDVVQEFNEFFIEEVGLSTKEEKALVGKLLAHTFGNSYQRVASIPQEYVMDFLDFYMAVGPEHTRKVLDSM